jgi:hypothetical protein
MILEISKLNILIQTSRNLWLLYDSVEENATEWLGNDFRLSIAKHR